MKKKIAILTQPLGSNYGGIIQNYALQKVLINLGYQPETIDRIYENKNSKLKIFLNKVKLSIYKHLLKKNVLTHSDQRRIFAKNREFLKKYVKRSKPISTNKELSRYFMKNVFDTVIVGSDQTWRPKYSPNIYNYYLDF